MSEDGDTFFISRNGAVWACWLGGKPAVKLGPDAEVLAAMAQFIAQAGGEAAPAPAPEPVAPPPPPPAPPRSPPPPKRQKAEGENDRVDPRHDITIIGRVRTGSGARDVTILDLSERGCRFHDRFGHLTEGTLLTIKLGPIGPVEAKVRWCESEYVGVEFLTPLHPSVMEHIRSHFDLRR